MAVPFVGRDSELCTLRSALDEATGGRGRLILVSGEPGIGKTRTTEELAAHAQERRAHVLWGRCYEGEGAPAFWPWLEVLRASVHLFTPRELRDAITHAPEVTQLLPALREHVPELDDARLGESAEARFRLFDAVGTFLARLTHRVPLLIIIDDLHDADRSSLLLLEFVARALRQLRVLIVATYRSGGVRGERGCSESLVELERLPSTQRLELHGLARDEVKQLVQARAGVSVPENVVTQLHERTEGNPLFVGEFIRTLFTGKRRPVTDPMWNTAVPDGVRAVIERRLAPLSAPCRIVLDAAAVIGREFAWQLLASVVVFAFPTEVASPMVVEQMLEEAEDSGVVSRSPGGRGRWRFGHALIRETLYDALRDSRRAELHRWVAQALEQAPDAHDRLTELTYHFSEAARSGGQDTARSDTEKAIAFARRAADQAMALLAYEEAVRLYRLGLDLLEGSGTGDDATRCVVLIDLGIAQNEASDLEASKTTLLRGAEFAKRLGLREELSRAALHFGTKVPWGERLFVDHALLRLLEDAIAVWEVDESPQHARLLARLARAVQFSPDNERRLYVSRYALEMARRVGDPGIIMEALHAWLLINHNPDNLMERAVLSEEMAQRAEQAHDLDLTVLAYAWRRMHFIELGDWSAAESALRTLGGLLETLRDPMHRWWSEIERATQSIHEGRFAAAEQEIQECLKLEQALNVGLPLAALAQMLDLWLTQGRRHSVEALAHALENPTPVVPPHVHRCLVAFVARELGRDAQARPEFERLAANDFVDFPRNEFWLRCMNLAAEVCAFLGDEKRAGLLVRLLAPYETRGLFNLVTKLYQGSVSHALGLLDATLARWDDATAHFEHALTMNRHMGSRPLLARTQYEYARMLVRRGHAGDNTRARALLEEAHATAHELDMPLLKEWVVGLGSQVADSEPVSGGGFPVPVPALDTQPRTPDRVFFREGDYWTLVYAGKVVRLKDSKGLQYLAHLLRHPGQELLALDLIQEQRCENGDEGNGTRDAGLPLLDGQAKREYRRRLAELRDELTAVEQFNDLGRAAKLRDEMEFLAGQLSAAVDLHGNDRKVGAAVERARLMVTKRIKSVLKALDAIHPPLAHHLRACVKTGYYCGYTPPPDQPVTWQI